MTVTYEYGFGLKENELIELCSVYPMDIERVREKIKQVDLTATNDDGDNLLSRVILAYMKMYHVKFAKVDGRYLIDVVKLFLENGFDLTRENGKFGAQCLMSLYNSSCDEYVLEACKILLKEGAQTKWCNSDGEDCIDASEWNDEYVNSLLTKPNSMERVSVMRTLNQIIKNYNQDIEYETIQYFKKAIGHSLTGVHLCMNDEDYNPIALSSYELELKGALAIGYDNTYLKINDSLEAMVDPNVEKEFTKFIDISELVWNENWVTDFYIKDIVTYNRQYDKDNVQFIQSLMFIILDNGKIIELSTDWKSLSQKETVSHIRVMSLEEYFDISNTL